VAEVGEGRDMSGESAYELLQEARDLLERRRPEKAVLLLEKAKAMEPHRGSILEALGVAYYNSGRPAKARTQFEEALEVDPTNHFARFGLGRCLHRAGLLQMAIGQMKLAVAMAPDNAVYGETLHRLERELGKGKEGGRR